MDMTIDHTYVYDQFKYWSTLGGVLWCCFKGFNWIKDIREKDLKNISCDVTNVSTEVRSQTNVIGNGFSNLATTMDRGFSELRNDFRAFYTNPDPVMVPVHARKTRKRTSVSNRVEAKAKPRAAVKPKPRIK